MAEYDINYDDPRFAQVQTDKNAALNEVDQTYDGMIAGADEFYQQQIDASQDYAETQSNLQQARTDFTIQQIEQNKEKARKDYIREQSGAYTDWQKQSNQYGANAEAMATTGMTNTGYSESSQVSMYNTYQNRIATARESYNLAVQNFDNAITEARLQNNAALAEIAYNAFQTQLDLSLQGFQYKNQLIMDKADKKADVDERYYNRWQDVLDQMNTENALAEDQRQFDESMAEDKRQFDEGLTEDKRQFDEGMGLEREQWEFEKDKETAKGSDGGYGPRDGGGPGPDDVTYYTTAMGDTGTAITQAIANGASVEEARGYIETQQQLGNITAEQAKALNILLDMET